MATAVEPDLHARDPAVRDLILLGEMSAAAVLRHKKRAQAPPSMLGLGSSPTHNCAYSVWLHAKLFVVRTNRWDLELEKLPAADPEWLVANAVVVCVEEPLFVS